MTAPTPDPTLGTGSSIGRYFSVVSVVPSVVFALWVYVIYASRAPSGRPSFGTLQANVSEPRFLVLALGLALAVAVVGHPLQFAMVQALEGYWGLGRLGVRLRVHLVQRHLRRLATAGKVRECAQRDYNALLKEAGGEAVVYLTEVTDDQHPKLAFRDKAERLARARVVIDEAAWVQAQYPDDPEHVLPTRLGNRLRRHELRAGRAVNLPIGLWSTHIGMVAKPEHSDYVGDQRTAMDLAVRTAWSMAAAALVTFAALWSAGWSVLLTLVPLAAAYLSYSGAVVAAGSYGAALQAWADLNRFRLYDELHLPHPGDADAERKTNFESLGNLIDGEDAFKVSYAKPQAENAQPPG